MKHRPIRALLELIEENIKPNFTMAEIGCYDGSTTIRYIKALKQHNGKVHIVDWFYGSENVEGVHAYVHNDDVYEQFKDIFSKYEDYMIIHRGNSHDQILNIPDNSLDLCFIDADHRYKSVYKDIELCLPKVKKGGIICGHDMEDINISDLQIEESWLEKDVVLSTEIGNPHFSLDYYHVGVIKAVFDHFGKDIEIRGDPVGQGLPIWIKRL